MVKTVDVNLVVNGNEKPVKMEVGVAFKNNGGIYTVKEDGKLYKSTDGNIWSTTENIVMNNYQYKAFCNVANNDNDGSTYTKEDIKKSIELYKRGGFKSDLSQDLPDGYRVEHPQRNDNTFVQAYVTNGHPNQSATLRFEILNDVTRGAKSNSTSVQNVATSSSYEKDKNVVIRTEKDEDGWTIGYNKYGQKILYKGTLSTIKYEYANKDAKKCCTMIYDMYNPYYKATSHEEMRNIKYGKDGSVVSYDMITNRDLEHESATNFSIYDTYTAVRVKNNKLYSVAYGLKDTKNWQQKLDKANLPEFNMDKDTDFSAILMLEELGFDYDTTEKKYSKKPSWVSLI